MEWYKIGQLYMISKHSHEQSDRGEGVEVVQNEPFEDPHHGNGQFTEKRVYLNRVNGSLPIQYLDSEGLGLTNQIHFQLPGDTVPGNSKLPSWARAVVPKIFYVTEKAWNYYPYTITGCALSFESKSIVIWTKRIGAFQTAPRQCSFLPKFSIHIETKYEDNKGSNDSVSSPFVVL
ncbi:cytoplasmic phosphatidylinositol transfer protein 1 [Cricetulus griseus]|nr:cytoplasmic phosphatidylinositol transfer protein 1 [Cricetulus griseus]